MKKLIKYVSGKTYMYPNGAIATPETILQDFPAIETFAHVIETDEAEEIVWSVMNLSAMRTMHNIDPALTESEAIDALAEIINAPPPTPEPQDDPLATALLALAGTLDNMNDPVLTEDEADWVKGLIYGFEGDADE